MQPGNQEMSANCQFAIEHGKIELMDPGDDKKTKSQVIKKYSFANL